MAAASVVLGIIMVATVDWRVAATMAVAGLGIWHWSKRKT
ncbi:hypothetical protein H4CHR_04369 [Variovorax sp. PBS-H4]|nr:hypothetical protein H4CHR_04369 [Variovorax sp. PBS-H4]